MMDDAELKRRAEEREAELLIEEEARRLISARRERGTDLDGLFLDREALRHLPRPEQLIPGVLPRHAYGVLRGRDQSFKSFVALDWSLTLATGRYWQADPVERVRVLYIAGEGAWGLSSRLAAWETARGTEVPPEWFTVRQAALNLHRPGPAFDHLLDHVGHREYGLVVVDTLRRVAGGADGNSSEMGAVVDNLDRIRRATADGTVLVVAHTDKGDTDSRGYSGIEDDADFVWHARRDELDLELQLVKMKDGPDGHSVRLRAQTVDQSLVLYPASPAAESEREAQALNQSAMKLLQTLRTAFPDGAHSGQLREASGLTSSTYFRALGDLRKRTLVRNEGSQQRPFFVIDATQLEAESQSTPTTDAPVIPVDSHHSQSTLMGLPPLPRPLGSGSSGSESTATVSIDPPSAEVAAKMDQLLGQLAGSTGESDDQ